MSFSEKKDFALVNSWIGKFKRRIVWKKNELGESKLISKLHKCNRYTKKALTKRALF
jgi:hypothetical protein